MLKADSLTAPLLHWVMHCPLPTGLPRMFLKEAKESQTVDW